VSEEEQYYGEEEEEDGRNLVKDCAGRKESVGGMIS
jgi:hypothetical protein